MNTSRPVRLQEIAEQAGCSKATVSLALRNHASIPPSTRTVVQEIATRLGYRPNPLVSALMTHQRASRPSRRTDITLAIVIDFARETSTWRQYLSAELLASAAERARQLGYRLEEFWRRDLELTFERLSSILHARGIPGVIIAPLRAARGHLRMEWAHFSPVAIGPSVLHPPLHRITTNRFSAMRNGLRHLRGVGYRRFGLAMQLDQDARVDHQWGAAFAWEQEQARPADRTHLFLAPAAEWNERQFAQWFRANRPEIVLGSDPRIVTWLKKLGQAVPGDVGFVRLWHPERSAEFAGICHDPRAIGTAAVDFVTGMIQRNERGLPANPQTLMLEALWQDGATIRRPAADGVV